MKHHYFFLAVAFLAMTVLVEAPLIVFPSIASEAYQGINIAHFGNDEHHYLTRAREILDGHSLGQPYLSEGKDLPDSFHSDVENVLLFPISLLGLGSSINVVWLYNAINALSVFLILILAYVLAYILSRDILIAAASSLFMVGGYSLLQDGTVLSALVHGEPLFSTLFNLYGRSIFPYAITIPLLGFLIFSYRAVMNEQRLVSIIVAGVLFGLLFYDAFYAWTFSLAFLGSLFLTSLIWRKWWAAIAAVMIGAVGLIVGSFKIVDYYRFFTSEMGTQISYFFLAVQSHAFIMSTTGLAVFALFIFYFLRNRTDANNFFILALIFAGWVSLEQQLITGRVVQYGHYYWYFVTPLSIIVAIYLLVRLIPQTLTAWKRTFCGIIIFAAFVNVAIVQYVSFPTTLPGKLREQDFAPIISKLNELPRGVVLGDPGTETYPLLITIYTDDDLYWAPEAPTSLFPISHMREAILTYWFLNKDARKNPVAYMKQSLKEPVTTAYLQMYRDFERYESGLPLDRYGATISESDPVLVATRERLLPELGIEYWERTMPQETFRNYLYKTRDIRYIVWDKKQYPEWDLSVLEPLTLLATSTDLALYGLNAP